MDLITRLGCLRAEVIYALFLDDVCQYIGRSSQVQTRIAKHRAAKRIPFNKCYIMTIPYANRAQVEELNMIQLFEPPYNIVGTSKPVKRLSQAQIAEQARALRRSLRKDGNGKLKLG